MPNQQIKGENPLKKVTGTKLCILFAANNFAAFPLLAAMVLSN